MAHEVDFIESCPQTRTQLSAFRATATRPREDTHSRMLAEQAGKLGT